eukprot:7387691-Prymnesium_polylepis.4
MAYGAGPLGYRRLDEASFDQLAQLVSNRLAISVGDRIGFLGNRCSIASRDVYDHKTGRLGSPGITSPDPTPPTGWV